MQPVLSSNMKSITSPTSSPSAVSTLVTLLASIQFGVLAVEEVCAAQVCMNSPRLARYAKKHPIRRTDDFRASDGNLMSAITVLRRTDKFHLVGQNLLFSGEGVMGDRTHFETDAGRSREDLRSCRCTRSAKTRPPPGARFGKELLAFANRKSLFRRNATASP
jgi:hypothetical protein